MNNRRVQHRVLVIEHVPVEHPGRLMDFLRSQSVEIICVRTYLRDSIPGDPREFSGIVVMGGPMGVYEQGHYPHLIEEIGLLERALADAVPVLGICLGSQLLAIAGGGQVYRGQVEEIGWVDIEVTPSAEADRLLRNLPRVTKVFSWHRDGIITPASAVTLARSEHYPCQAFRIGDTAYGLLFHPEVTKDMILSWIEYFRHDVGGRIRTSDILDQVDQALERQESYAKRVLAEAASFLSGSTTI